MTERACLVCNTQGRREYVHEIELGILDRSMPRSSDRMLVWQVEEARQVEDARASINPARPHVGNARQVDCVTKGAFRSAYGPPIGQPSSASIRRNCNY